MEGVKWSEQEQRTYAELFSVCDVENTGKISGVKAAELFLTSGLTQEVLHQVSSTLFYTIWAFHIYFMGVCHVRIHIKTSLTLGGVPKQETTNLAEIARKQVSCQIEELPAALFMWPQVLHGFCDSHICWQKTFFVGKWDMNSLFRCCSTSSNKKEFFRLLIQALP